MGAGPAAGAGVAAGAAAGAAVAAGAAGAVVVAGVALEVEVADAAAGFESLFSGSADLQPARQRTATIAMDPHKIEKLNFFIHSLNLARFEHRHNAATRRATASKKGWTF
jgi:hypothetical protein